MDSVHSIIIHVSRHKKYSELESRMTVKRAMDGIRKRKQQRILHKPRETTLKVYDLPENKPLSTFTLKNDCALLSYKFYLKKEDRYRYKKRLAICVLDKYKIISTDLRKRLHMNNPSNEVSTILDVDEHFYECVKGRRVEHQSAQYKSLKIYLNNQVRLRQKTGYKQDCISNIDVNQRKELDVYNLSLQKLTEQANYFDKFISEDYRESMVLLERADKLVSKVDKTKAELENLAAQKFMISSKLLGLDYKYSLQQKYGRFLYYLSPPSWRAMHRDFARSVEIEARGFDLGRSNEEDTFTVLYEKLRKECFGEFVKPVLFFTEPKHLMEVFQMIEQQQVHHFTHVSHFSPHTKMLNENITSLKEAIAQESAAVVSTIKYFKNLLIFSEERSILLKEKFFKVLQGFYYKSVGALDVLRLVLHLEFCYEKIFNEKPINKDMKTLAKALETFYMDYTKQLDLLHNDRVRRAINVCLETERNKARRAVVASRELRLFCRLERELLRAHGFSVNACDPVLSFDKSKQEKTCKKKYVKPKISINKRKSLTEAQKDYLMLFTEWNENDDPAYYLQDLII
ncbi:unnamed protein product [Parnassius apollo]|uniref:(apollo) hypothetical protein n=1 Tax=Parnassius apollo TaxID=110799 RepID=A0A8S3XHD2_PARAO|nr:unnamed protein product [Parnassius apollo]